MPQPTVNQKNEAMTVAAQSVIDQAQAIRVAVEALKTTEFQAGVPLFFPEVPSSLTSLAASLEYQIKQIKDQFRIPENTTDPVGV